MNRTHPVNNQHRSVWLELLITLLGIIGVILFLSFYDRALPSAAIDLKYSREQISQLAEPQLRELGFSSAGYEYALSFNEDNMPAYYLQRTLGVEETNTLCWLLSHPPVFFGDLNRNFCQSLPAHNPSPFIGMPVLAICLIRPVFGGISPSLLFLTILRRQDLCLCASLFLCCLYSQIWTDEHKSARDILTLG